MLRSLKLPVSAVGRTALPGAKFVFVKVRNLKVHKLRDYLYINLVQDCSSRCNASMFTCFIFLELFFDLKN